jgi:hypothetical protein
MIEKVSKQLDLETSGSADTVDGVRTLLFSEKEDTNT